MSRYKRKEPLEDEDDNFQNEFQPDHLKILRKQYGQRVDTIHGCLELLESMISGNDGQIPPNNVQYNLIYSRFEELMNDAKANGVNIGEYRRDYRNLVKMERRGSPVKDKYDRTKTEQINILRQKHILDDIAKAGPPLSFRGPAHFVSTDYSGVIL